MFKNDFIKHVEVFFEAFTVKLSEWTRWWSSLESREDYSLMLCKKKSRPVLDSRQSVFCWTAAKVNTRSVTTAQVERRHEVSSVMISRSEQTECDPIRKTPVSLLNWMCVSVVSGRLCSFLFQTITQSHFKPEAPDWEVRTPMRLG